MNSGWGKSSDSKLYHYFVDGVPLCNGCGLPINPYGLEQGNDSSDENCKRCQTLLKKHVQPPPEKCKVCHRESNTLYKGICQSCRRAWGKAKASLWS